MKLCLKINKLHFNWQILNLSQDFSHQFIIVSETDRHICDNESGVWNNSYCTYPVALRHMQGKVEYNSTELSGPGGILISHAQECQL